MKGISKHHQNVVMKHLVKSSRIKNDVVVELLVDPVPKISSKKWFNDTLRYLENAGYLRIDWEERDVACAAVMSKKGLTYFETEHAIKSERWWTRGLAIAALIISLAALLLEFHDRGWLTPARIFQGQPAPTILVSPAPTMSPLPSLSDEVFS